MDFYEKKAVYKRALERFCNGTHTDMTKVEFGDYTAIASDWKTTFRSDLGYSVEQCYILLKEKDKFFNLAHNALEASKAIGLLPPPEFQSSMNALNFWVKHFKDMVISTELNSEAPEPTTDKYEVVYFAEAPNN